MFIEPYGFEQRRYKNRSNRRFLELWYHISHRLVWPCSPASCSLGAPLLQNNIWFLSDRINMLPILLLGVVSQRGRVPPQVLAKPSKHMCRWHALACKPF